MNNQNNKGQVTVFIIIGLVVILIVALYFFAKGMTGGETEPLITHDFSGPIATIQAGVDQCITQAGVEAFQYVFAHAGYADPVAQGFVVVDEVPTRGNALRISPQSSSIIPLWLEQEGGSRCTSACSVSLHIPPLTRGAGSLSIEEQAEKLVEERAINCLKTIGLTDDYTLTTADEVSVLVTIGEDVVHYKVDWPVTIRYEPTATETQLEQFTIQHASQVKALYEIGVHVLNGVELDNFTASLGKATKTIITAYGLGQHPAIPPITGSISFQAQQPQMWLLSDVKAELQTYLSDNLPLIQFWGTRDASIVSDPNRHTQSLLQTEGFSPNIIFPYPEQAAQTKISIAYEPSWQPDLHISPSSGYLIRPESGIFSLVPGLPSLGYTEYKFSYDLIYPVLVRLRLENGIAGEPLTLIYGLETGLRNNEPLSYAGVKPRSYGSDVLFSRESSRNRGLVSITTKDALTGEPVPDVVLTYVCGQDMISAGVSVLAETRAISYTSLPTCLGGLVTGRLTGYHSEPVDLSIVGDEDAAVELNLYPLKEFPLKIRSRMVGKLPDGSWSLGASSEGFITGDQELVYVFTKKSLPGEEAFVIVNTITQENELDSTVSLVPGTYDIEAYVITHFGDGYSRASFVVPEATVEFDADLWDTLGLSEGDSYTIPAVTFDESLPTGGLSLTESAGTMVEVTPDDYGKDEVTLWYINFNLDQITTHEDLGIIGEVEAYSTANQEYLGLAFS